MSQSLASMKEAARRTIEAERDHLLELSHRIHASPELAFEEEQSSQSVADAALAMLEVDRLGLDIMDRKLLLAVIEKFAGGPVGIDNLAAAVGEERDTLEDVVEPYLIQQGLLQRTPRGRTATLAAFRHLGVASPQSAGSDLFGAT